MERVFKEPLKVDKMQDWLICDHIGKSFCLYQGSWADHQKRLRCIKHGTILNYATSVRGMSRRAARAKLETEQKQEA